LITFLSIYVQVQAIPSRQSEGGADAKRQQAFESFGSVSGIFAKLDESTIQREL